MDLAKTTIDNKEYYIVYWKNLKDPTLEEACYFDNFAKKFFNK